MDFIKKLDDVRSVVPGVCPELRRSNEGRLVITGPGIDLFDLVRWLDHNPLSQFRNWARPQDDEDSKPHHLFAHMFDSEGNVL